MALNFPDPLAIYGQEQQILGYQAQAEKIKNEMAEARRKQEIQNRLIPLRAQAFDPMTGQLDYNKLRQSAISAPELLPSIMEEEGEYQKGQAAIAEKQASAKKTEE